MIAAKSSGAYPKSLLKAKMPRPKNPQVVFTLLADNHKVADNQKIDAFGIFNKLAVWDNHATREFSLIFGISYLPKTEREFIVLLKNAEGVMAELATFYVKANKPQADFHNAIRVVIPITNIGKYNITIASKNASEKNMKWMPFEVVLLDWPSLPTGDNLQAILKDPHGLKAARVSLSCNGCNKKYIFELSIDPEHSYSKNAKPFPKSGELKCSKCQKIHFLRDIEGQLTSRLSNQGGERGQE